MVKMIESLLSRMSLEEKIEMLGGMGFHTKANERLGIPPIKMTDGPAGVRGGISTAFPVPIALAASWDIDLLERVGAAMGMETRAKGSNYLLAPCVNIHRHPLGGRNFESYGEDPFLASRMAVPFIKGLQSQKILASVKHLACNNQEWERFKLDVLVGERALREIYLPAFKAAVQEAGVWTVMSAYNKLNGYYCSENEHLLKDILKGEWGFKGFVVSDWGATHSTIESAVAGLDLEMPFGSYFNEELVKAVRGGKVAEQEIDDKVRRLLKAMYWADLFTGSEPPDLQQVMEQNRSLVLEAARKSIVLLKNDRNLLPLKKGGTLAVIGPNARYARTGGGGSSKIVPAYSISPLDAMQDYADSLLYAPGTAMEDDILTLDADFEGEYFKGTNLEGQPVLSRLDGDITFNWGYDGPHPELHMVDDKNKFSVRWTGILKPSKSGVYKLNLIFNDGARLYLDNEILINEWEKGATRLRSASIKLEAGKEYHVLVEYFFDGGISEIKFGWEVPGEDLIQEAVDIAKKADVAIVFAGLSDRFESESFDRERMELPRQARLIKAVVETNPNTVVFLQTGSPVLMEWADSVPCIVQAWYGGQECGRAVADVLFGCHNPSGKLPFSIIRRCKDSPAFEGYRDENFEAHYNEGIYVGYRYLDKYKIEPQFPFGHGLSYTKFEYSDLAVVKKEDEVMVSCSITNIGENSGSEVAQVYVKDVESSLERPEKELKAFAKVYLEPGESQNITLKLTRSAFSFYDPEKGSWILEPGVFEIMVGSSSQDMKLMGRFTF